MKAGDRVLNYIVDRELGEGGMGTVYLARHTALDQFVAIKSLSLMLSRDEALRARFLQEANIQAKLRHPGIVQVLTADMESEQPSLVMEYIEGRSLSEVLELRGALPIDDALKIMEQVLSAVGYAHRQGVIHRDLKPSNVMVMGSGEAKVTDFGIAKVLGSSKLTRTGTVMGSAHYMSPEQIRRPETVDARSDIYSLGCVFYEVLTGRPPFGEKDESGTESDFEIKIAHVNATVRDLNEFNNAIPAWLNHLVMEMLEKEAEQRPSSCEEILEKIKAGDVALPNKKADKTVIMAAEAAPVIMAPSVPEAASLSEPLSSTAPTSEVISIPETSAKSAPEVKDHSMKFLVGLVVFFMFIFFMMSSGSKMEAAPPAPEPESNQVNDRAIRCKEIGDRWQNLQKQAFEECSGTGGSGIGGDGPRCKARIYQAAEAKQELDLACGQALSK
jgi:serine/threonine protein kinase